MWLDAEHLGTVVKVNSMTGTRWFRVPSETCMSELLTALVDRKLTNCKEDV